MFPSSGYLYFSSGPRQSEYDLTHKSVVRVLLNYGWLNCYWHTTAESPKCPHRLHEHHEWVKWIKVLSFILWSGNIAWIQMLLYVDIFQINATEAKVSDLFCEQSFIFIFSCLCRCSPHFSDVRWNISCVLQINIEMDSCKLFSLISLPPLTLFGASLAGCFHLCTISTQLHSKTNVNNLSH